METSPKSTLNWMYTPKEMAVLYAITGGVGEYLFFINPQKSIKENIIHLYLEPSGRMYEEPVNLLKQELRNPNMYHAILNSIASGNTTLNDIATKAGELTSSASFHLRSLMQLGIVKKETAIGVKENAKKTLYRIEDSSFIFWYKFVYPNQSMIALNNGNYIYENFVEKELSNYMGGVFESICQMHMLQNVALKQAPFFYKNIGKWWGSNAKSKQQEELDVCAMDSHHVLLGECKWTNDKVDKQVLDDLLRQGEMFPQENKYFYLFSKNGFSEYVIEFSKTNEHIHLILIDDMYISN